MHQITRAQKARTNTVNKRAKRYPNKFDADSKQRDGLAFFVPAFFSLAFLIVPVATAILAFDFLNQQPTLSVASTQIEPAYRSRTTSKKDFIKKLNEAWGNHNCKRALCSNSVCNRSDTKRWARGDSPFFGENDS